MLYKVYCKPDTLGNAVIWFFLAQLWMIVIDLSLAYTYGRRPLDLGAVGLPAAWVVVILVVLVPLIETVLVVFTVRILARTELPDWSLIILSTLAWTLIHLLSNGVVGLAALIPFAFFTWAALVSRSYLPWWKAVLVISLAHGLLNGFMLAYSSLMSRP